MTGELETALAFIARRDARTAMTGARWAHVLSFELGWMNPGQARAFVQRAVTAGILTPDDDQLRFVLDPAAISVPRGFKPNPDALATAAPATPQAQPDLFLGWVARLAAHQGATREHVLGRVAAVQERLGGLLTAEAAVLCLARDAGLEVARDAGRALQGFMPNPGGTPAPESAGNP